MDEQCCSKSHMKNCEDAGFELGPSVRSTLKKSIGSSDPLDADLKRDCGGRPAPPTLGYDADFDPPLENKYECPICLMALRTAVQTPCGHRFCRGCIERSIRWVFRLNYGQTLLGLLGTRLHEFVWTVHTKILSLQIGKLDRNVQ